MAFLVKENSRFSRFQEQTSFEHRPMMLKDFLMDDCFHTMYPIRIPCKSTAIVSPKPNKRSMVLLRSRSKKAAARTISAIHKVINVAKFFQFASVKSPSASISRKLQKRSKDKNDILRDVSEVKVKVKDILRWKSFRDMVEDNSTPLDFPSTPNQSTTTTATSASCSNGSSWCDSDFTAEELPLWVGENEEVWGKKCFLGELPAATATLRNPKRNWSLEESEQQSPVSVFDDSPFQQVEGPISPCHPTLARAKSMLERMQELESVTQQQIFTRRHSFEGEIAKCEQVNVVEEKAKKLLSHLEEEGKNQANNERMLLDFFIHEVSINGKFDDVKFDHEILRIAKSWINGEFDDESNEWEWEDNREVYVKDMEKGVCWNKFKQEQEEVSKELEVTLWDELMDELLTHFLTK